MKEKIKNLCEQVIANDGVISEISELADTINCNELTCDICPFSSYNDNIPCYKRNPELNIKKAKEYIQNYYIDIVTTVTTREGIPFDTQVNSPKHYNVGKIEVIEAIEEWKLNFNLGNAIKYIARCEHKENKKQDLEKAKWYIERELRKCQ